MKRIDQILDECSSAVSLAQLSECLDSLFTEGYSIAADGALYEAKHEVGRIKGMKIEIRPREHAPPHFHVTKGDIDASFSIEDCSLLAGSIGSREQRLIEFWHTKSKGSLVKIWNETRPENCPVGATRL
ncbi:DUF4160 domain-containing protein [Pseudoduganella violacea]|uniref:DUF4160 domain-containing protein n=1 Tax=Pseudoduganella violacea TaxID=1715466 RepID=A0A7W5FX47_9BURK|nr:DUF4160 domain-containing protein [Pseudoduganella violacea]MBB3122482.1 hypothetical protein [Pseudoduganella violacea]